MNKRSQLIINIKINLNNGALADLKNTDLIIQNSTHTRPQVKLDVSNLNSSGIKFVKYCKKKHRIDKVKMIRIMTLEDYQEIEDEKRADLNEGIIDGYLSSVGRQKLLLSANEINQKIGVEKFTHNDMNKKICTLENSRIFLQNKQQLPNCYVFCCSEFTRNKKLEKKFGGAYYEINHIENFKNLLCSELEKKLKLNKLIKEDIHLKAIFQKVQYMSKKTIDFDNLQSNSKGYFLKNTFWKDEKEYRIIFVALDHKKNIISINKGHIDINNNDKLKNYCYVKQN